MTALVEAAGLALPGRLAATSFTLAAGELVGLVGPNGSGKTSLLHALAGIGSPQGDVRVDGEDPSRAGPARRIRLLTYLPATRELRWPLEARDLIRLGGAAPEQVEAMMLDLDLARVAGRRLDHLSTGERSRVLIARALAPCPKLLLLDEPTANLDPLWQIRLLDRLKAEILRHGQAALVAIHDLDAAARFADRLLVMQAGEVVADGEPAAILSGPVVAEVFGIARRDGVWQPVG